MKKIVLILFLLLFVQNLLADEIYFRDGSVIKGSVIQVTAEYIEYDPEDSRPFDVIPRDQVVKIIYNDGREVTLSAVDAAVRKKENTSVANNNDVSTSQGEIIEKYREPESSKSRKPFYINLESGWNGYTGAFGGRFEFAFFRIFSINAGIGYGLWGYRYSAGLRYFLSGYSYGPAFGFGFSLSSGFKDLEMEGKVTDSQGNNYGTQTLVFDFKPVAFANFSFIYNFKVGNRHKIYFEVGYGLRLSKTEDNYSFKLKDSSGSENIKLDDGTKNTLDTMQPGGLILSAGFGIGI